MRSLIFTLLITASGIFSAMAQQGSNFVFFAPEGEQFYLILNGIRQNENPETNVKVQNVTGMMVKAKIIFANTDLGEVDKTIPMPEYPSESTWQIKMTKKGEYAIRYFGDVPIAQAPPPAPNQTVVVVNTDPMPPISSTTTTTTTTTVTGTGTTGTSESVNVGVSVGGVGFGMNVEVNEGYGGGGVVYEESTTTTTVTTTTETAPPPADDHYVMPGYSGPIGCPWPMQPGDFNSAKQSISSKSFEDSKFTVAKQIFNSNCLTSDQVRDIMGLFDFEDTKLDFAKYAYGRTYDLGNYYKVNDAFTFESSIDELNDFINGGNSGW